MNVASEKVKDNNYDNYINKLCTNSQPVSISLKKLDIAEIFSDEDFGNDNDFIDLDNFEKSGINVIDEKDLTKHQKDTISLGTDWYHNRRKIDPVFVVGGTAGSGKAIPVDTIIPTPDGGIRFGDLNVGDYIYDRRGKLTRVTAIYPQGILDNYKITFSDGRESYSNDEHLWSYITSKGNIQTKTLKEMMLDYKKQDNRGHYNYKYRIPINKAVEYQHKILRIDPYVMGAFIGDGCLLGTSALRFSSEDEELVQNIAELMNWDAYKECDTTFNWFFRKKGDTSNNRIQVKDIFNEYPEILNKYSYDKTIPYNYQYSSVEQRMALIQGLMDTDGTIRSNDRGNLCFSSTSRDLIYDLREMLFSLGYLCSVSEDCRKEKYTQGICYSLNINVANSEKPKFFRLSRKKEIALKLKDVPKRRNYDRISIRNIEFCGRTEMMCIDVCNNEHLFLTNDFIVTHNCLHENSTLFYEDRIGQIKDVTIGDKIYGADGRLCTVIEVFPQDELKKCFKLTFNDGTNIVADNEQLFNYSIDNINFITGTLEDIKAVQTSVYFPINKALRIKRKELSLPPTLVGFLLNYDCLDFEFYQDFFTMYLNESLLHAKDLINDIINIMKMYGYILNTNNVHRGVLSFTAVDETLANDFKNKVTQMKLINFNKQRHIPNEYIYSPIKDKHTLLKAMLSVDIINHNDITIKIAHGIENDIRLLIEMLGGLVFKTTSENEIIISLSKISTTVESKLLIKQLIDIQELDGVYNTICIKVDNQDQLYISNDCIVVHNTSIIPHFINNIDLKSTGHALPYNAKVLKRNGFVPICTLKVGDEICGGNGEFCKVKGVYPQGEREMYKLHFSDGSTTVCDKEHLWTVATLNEKFGTYTLDYIMKQGLVAPTGRVKFRIPLVQPVQFSKKKLPIHPYLLGAMINGIFNRGDAIIFRTKHREIIPCIKELLARHNYKLSDPIINTDTGTEEYYILSKTETRTNNWLNNKLHELRLRNLESQEKFIPPIYLFGSPEQRRQLLNGLIDTFGTFNHKSNTTTLKAGNKHAFTVEFTSKSLQLLKDIQFLTESLGGITDLHEVSAAYHKIADDKIINSFEGWYKMSIKIRAFGMRIVNTEFTERCNMNKVLLNRTITKIENLNEKMEAICIEIDEPHGLFVTNNFIVTHNTTVNSKIAYATFTGRAAMALQRKGIPATTIHKLIYDYKVEKDRRGIIKKAYFEKKKALSPRLKLIIIDEFSMVSTEMMKDLMSFGIPIVMFGDPCQLPPVGGNLNPYLNKFNIMLTEVHRQAADNPILTLATNVRNGNLGLKYGDYGRLKILPKSQLNKDTMFSADQVICGTNTSRQDINNSFREHLGRRSLLPENGDKVICLKNNWEVPPIDDFYLVNGMIGYISDLGMDSNGKPIFDFMPDFLDKPFWKLRYEPKIFLGEVVKSGKWGGFGLSNQFDYGYAITCHKCLPGDTLIYTNKGIKQLKDLDNNASIGEFKPIDDDVKIYNGDYFERPSHFYNNGIDKINYITTKKGYSIGVTNNHQCYVLNSCGEIDIIKGDELQINDTLLIRKSQNLTHNNYPQFDVVRIYDQQDVRAKTYYTLPTIMTLELGRILGYICADGFITKGVSYSKKYKECVVDFIEKFNHVFNTDIKIQEKNNYFTGEIQSTLIRDFFHSLGGLEPNNKFIPNCILESPIEVQKEFLKSFFEDGTVHLKDGKFDMIELSFKNPRLIKQLQALLTNIGIEGTYGLTQNVKSKNNYPLYHCYIYSKGANVFKKEIGFISSFKQERLDLVDFKFEQTGNKILGKRFANILDLNKISSQKIRNLKRTYNLTETNFNSIYNDLPKNIQQMKDIQNIKSLYSNYLFEDIISINIKEEPTYCLTMPDTHKFIQNGFLMGNSQGGEFENVIVWEEVLRRETHAQWLYTAITRASETLLIYH